MNILNAVI